MTHRPHRRRRLNPSPLGVAALALGTIAVVAGVAYGISRARRAAQLRPGKPTGGDTLEPIEPIVPVEPAVAKIYLPAMWNGDKTVFGPTEANAATDLSGQIIEVIPHAGVYPVDVVLSVPAAYRPIDNVALKNAEIIAGVPGTTRDIVVRVYAPTTLSSGKPTITFGTEFWINAESAALDAMKVYLV